MIDDGDDRSRPGRPDTPGARDEEEEPRDRRRPGFVAARGVLLVVVLLVAATGVVDRPARDYTDGVMQRALVTFAAARGLDAAISLAQGTEIALQPAGMGLTFGAGEILDPLNDLVEQFSSLMLIASVSLGMQSLVLRISGWWGFTVFLAVAAALVAATAFGGPSARRWLPVARRVLLVALILRFTLPVLALGSAAVFNGFLVPMQERATGALETTAEDIEQMERLDERPETLPEGWRERLSAWMEETLGRTDVEGRIAAFRARIGDAVEHVIDLMVVFVLQTIVLPLGLLWLLPRLAGFALDRLA